MEGHLQHQMKLEIIDLDICLLIIELMHLHLKTILDQRYLYFLPNLKLVAKIDQHLDSQVDVTQSEYILIPHDLLLPLTLHILQLKSMFPPQILQLQSQYILPLYVGQGYLQAHHLPTCLNCTICLNLLPILNKIFFAILAHKMHIFG